MIDLIVANTVNDCGVFEPFRVVRILELLQVVLSRQKESSKLNGECIEDHDVNGIDSKHARPNDAQMCVCHVGPCD